MSSSIHLFFNEYNNYPFLWKWDIMCSLFSCAERRCRRLLYLNFALIWSFHPFCHREALIMTRDDIRSLPNLSKSFFFFCLPRGRRLSFAPKPLRPARFRWSFILKPTDHMWNCLFAIYKREHSRKPFKSCNKSPNFIMEFVILRQSSLGLRKVHQEKANISHCLVVIRQTQQRKKIMVLLHYARLQVPLKPTALKRKTSVVPQKDSFKRWIVWM